MHDGKSYSVFIITLMLLLFSSVIFWSMNYSECRGISKCGTYIYGSTPNLAPKLPLSEHPQPTHRHSPASYQELPSFPRSSELFLQPSSSWNSCPEQRQIPIGTLYMIETHFSHAEVAGGSCLQQSSLWTFADSQARNRGPAATCAETSA